MGIHPKTHKTRNDKISEYLEDKYPGLWEAYEALLEESRKARYHCLPPNPMQALLAGSLLEEIKEILSRPPQRKAATGQAG